MKERTLSIIFITLILAITGAVVASAYIVNDSGSNVQVESNEIPAYTAVDEEIELNENNDLFGWGAPISKDLRANDGANALGYTHYRWASHQAGVPYYIIPGSDAMIFGIGGAIGPIPDANASNAMELGSSQNVFGCSSPYWVVSLPFVTSLPYNHFGANTYIVDGMPLGSVSWFALPTVSDRHSLTNENIGSALTDYILKSAPSMLAPSGGWRMVGLVATDLNDEDVANASSRARANVVETLIYPEIDQYVIDGMAIEFLASEARWNKSMIMDDFFYSKDENTANASFALKADVYGSHSCKVEVYPFGTYICGAGADVLYPVIGGMSWIQVTIPAIWINTAINGFGGAYQGPIFTDGYMYIPSEQPVINANDTDSAYFTLDEPRSIYYAASECFGAIPDNFLFFCADPWMGGSYCYDEGSTANELPFGMIPPIEESKTGAYAEFYDMALGPSVLVDQVVDSRASLFADMVISYTGCADPMSFGGLQVMDPDWEVLTVPFRTVGAYLDGSSAHIFGYLQDVWERASLANLNVRAAGVMPIIYELIVGDLGLLEESIEIIEPISYEPYFGAGFGIYVTHDSTEIT